MPRINMRSTAHTVKGQGVGSCYEEQVGLVKDGLKPEFEVYENQTGKYDIVHYHTINPGFFIERIFSKKSTVGIGYVHFLPDTLDDSLQMPKLFKKIFYKYVLAFYNSMDYLVTVNPYMVKRIEEHGVTKPVVHCIPNFVSSKKFYPLSEEEIMETKKKFGIPSEKFVVLGVGQLQKRKGIFDFIETAKQLPDVQFLWAGGFSFGKLSDGHDEIKKILENPPKNVKFLGIVDRTEMPGLYNICDVMFLPSFEELFPMAILEALCCKKPVLLRDVPLYKDILFDNYLKGKDVNDFIHILSEVSADDNLYSHWSEKSWECHNIYLEEHALKQWEEFYEQAYMSKRENG